MANSTRKTPIFGNCVGSDTTARRNGNRAIRRATHALLATLNPEDYADVNFPEAGEVRGTSEWSWPQDGRRWGGEWISLLDPEVRAKVMSK
jgi:hypothetical protein